MPPPRKLNEKTWFIRDNETDQRKKNSLLAKHLDGAWKRLHIVRVKRIEIGDRGWLATYRSKPTSRSRSGGTAGSDN
jgi:hypothetical protein